MLSVAAAAADSETRDKGEWKMNRNQSAGMSVKMVIAMVLLAASFLMLFFPWVKISIDIYGQEYTMEDLVEKACYEEDMSRADFDYELQDELYDTLSDLSDYGISVNAKKALKTLNMVLKGKLSVFNLVKLTSYVNSLMSKLIEYAEASLNSYGIVSKTYIMQELSGYEDVKQVCFIAMLAVSGLLIVTAVCFILALRSIWTGRKGGLISYILIYLVLLVGILVGINQSNDLLQGISSYLTSMIASFGFSSNSITSLELFHVASAPVWGIVFVAAATVVSLLGGGSLRGKAAFASVGSWDCPSCGCSNDGSSSFCMACGTRRPERTTCECGAPIKPGTSFCGRCGRRLVPAQDTEY